MNKKKNTTKKILSRLITILCVSVFLYAAYGLADVFIDYYKNRKMLSEVQDMYYDVASAKEDDDDREPGEVRSGFDELLKHNDHVVGWITIDDTQIDYPILQTDNNIDYLTKDYNDRVTRAGSIFLDFRNDITKNDKNTVIYGHRMKDGSMFQHLTKFLNEDFFKEHQTFEYDTLYDSYEAEIFSVYNTLTDFNYIETDFQSEETYEQLLQKMKEKSRFTTGVEVNPEDHIITLSTCDYELDENEGRLVVHAKLVKK
ncbi:MAG TPA: class B sortase [Bacillota bacterium]|nr:class B sortase [Bacillota bacterium]